MVKGFRLHTEGLSMGLGLAAVLFQTCFMVLLVFVFMIFLQKN